MNSKQLEVLARVFGEHMDDALEVAHETYAEAVGTYGASEYGTKAAIAMADVALLDHLSGCVTPRLEF